MKTGNNSISEGIHKREKDIYEQYQKTISYFIVELEVRDVEFPVEIFNEIRSIFTHLARFKLQNSLDDLTSAERHVKRAILDCYKYMCVSYAEEISQFRESYRKVDLKIADNGAFLPKLDQLEHKAKMSCLLAKRAEITSQASEDELYKLFEEAYNNYENLSSFLNDSYEAILFASSHSKRSNVITIISTIITIISYIFSLPVPVSRRTSWYTFLLL